MLRFAPEAEERLAKHQFGRSPKAEFNRLPQLRFRFGQPVEVIRIRPNS